MNGIFSQFLFFIYIQTIWHDYMVLDAQAAKIIKSIDLTQIHFIKKNPNPSDSNPFIYLNWKTWFWQAQSKPPSWVVWNPIKLKCLLMHLSLNDQIWFQVFIPLICCAACCYPQFPSDTVLLTGPYPFTCVMLFYAVVRPNVIRSGYCPQNQLQNIYC